MPKRTLRQARALSRTCRTTTSERGQPYATRSRTTATAWRRRPRSSGRAATLELQEGARSEKAVRSVCATLAP